MDSFVGQKMNFPLHLRGKCLGKLVKMVGKIEKRLGKVGENGREK